MELLGQNKVDHNQRKVTIVSQDSFYHVLTPEQKAKALKGQYNFDHPGKQMNINIMHQVNLSHWEFSLKLSTDVKAVLQT